MNHKTTTARNPLIRNLSGFMKKEAIMPEKYLFIEMDETASGARHSGTQYALHPDIVQKKKNLNQTLNAPIPG